MREAEQEIVLRVTFWLRSIGTHSMGPLCYVKRPKGKRAPVNLCLPSVEQSVVTFARTEDKDSTQQGSMRLLLLLLWLYLAPRETSVVA